MQPNLPEAPQTQDSAPSTAAQSLSEDSAEEQNAAETEALRAWANYLAASRGRAQSTIAAYQRSLQRLRQAVAPKPLTDLHFKDLETHLRQLYLTGVGASARAGAVSAIRSYYGWLAARGDVEKSPALDLERPQVYTAEAPVLTRGEVKTFLYSDLDRLPTHPLELRDRVLLVVMYWGGLRVSEPGRLDTRDLVWDGKRCSLLIRRAKAAGGDTRQDLDDEASRLLAIYLQATTTWRGKWTALFPAERTGRGLSSSRVRAIFEARWRDCGLRVRGRRISPHILRHSLATHLLKAGADIEEVRQILRHRSLVTTQRYVHSGGRAAGVFRRCRVLGPHPANMEARRGRALS